MGLRQAFESFLDDLSQAVLIGQGKIEILDQASQFGRHLNRGCSDHQGAAVGRELLPDITQAAYYHGTIHVAVKILQDEHRLDSHGFQVGQHLHRILCVVDSRLAGFRGIGIGSVPASVYAHL